MRTRPLILIAILLLPPLVLQASVERIAPIEAALAATEWKTAGKLARDWVKGEPGNADAHYWLAVSLRVKMQEVNQLRAMATLGDYKEALAAAIQLDPRHVDARIEQIGFLIQAPGIAGGDRAEARQKIAALRELDPAEAADMQVMLAQAEEDPEALMAALTELRALDPENREFTLQSALALISEERFDEADALLIECEDATQPGVALGAQYQRARWRIVASRETVTAIDLLMDYLDRRGDADLPYAPDRAAALWRLGLAQEQAGAIDQALAALERSVALNDDFDPALKDLRRLQRGRSAPSAR